MNTTEYFKRTIQAYLEERAMEDELFAAKYDNPDKNIDDCVTYILNWVQKSGCNGFCDDEIKQVFSSTKELFFTLLEEQTIRVEQLAPPYLKYLVKNFISIISYQELFSKHGSYFLYIV